MGNTGLINSVAMWLYDSIMSRKWDLYAKYTSFVYACYPYHGHIYTNKKHKKDCISLLFLQSRWNRASVLYCLITQIIVGSKQEIELSLEKTIYNQFVFQFIVVINYKFSARKHSIYPVCDAILHPIFDIFVLLEK